MYKKSGYILIFLLSVFSNLNAQTKFEEFNFVGIDAITTKDPISAIVKDEFGIVWIGTYGSGIYSFDGLNYKSYSFDFNELSSISGNLIHQIFIDDAKNIWVGTDSGLNLYNRDLDRFQEVNITADVPIPDHYNAINVIADDLGNLLVSTYSPGILKINSKTYETTLIPATKSDGSPVQTNVFAKDDKGTVYLGTNQGLFKYNATSNNIDQVVIASGSMADNPIAIESLVIDKNQNLWAGSHSFGIFKISSNNGNTQAQHFPCTKRKIFSMIADDNFVVAGTENDGLFVLDQQNGAIIRHYEHYRPNPKSITSNSIWSLYRDDEERIWFGYYDRGVAVFDKRYSKFKSYEAAANKPQSLRGLSVSGLDKDTEGRIWIALRGGLDIFDPKTGIFRHIQTENPSEHTGFEGIRNLQTVFIDSNENVWVSTWDNGLFLLKKGSTHFVNYSISSTKGILATNAIRCFTEDANGRVWIGTFLQGMYYYDPVEDNMVRCNSEAFVSSGLLNADVLDIIVDVEETIWAGTSSGLFKINSANNNEFTVIPMRDKMPIAAKDHPSIHRISKLYESKDGTIWVGTKTAGLLMYDREKDIFNLSKDRFQLKETTINSIIEDDNGAIWIGGKYGISKIDRERNTSKRFTESDGLLMANFNASAIGKDNDGVLYFGSFKGINAIDPNKIEYNQSAPVLYFTDFKLFNKTIHPNDENKIIDKVISRTNAIDLAYNQSVFSIGYMGTTHTHSEKTQYAYILEGFDADWNYVGMNRSATYTNLPQGDYVFKVKAANNDGVWTTKSLDLKIRVNPPWWKSNLAYFLYALAVLTAILIAYKIILHRIKAKQIALVEQERRIQEKRLNKTKLQFFTNISHEFRTPLTLIINPINDIINRSDLNFPEPIRQKHHVVFKNAQRLSRLINELMDFRKLESNKVVVKAQLFDAVKYVKEIIGFFEEEAKHRNIALSFKANKDQIMLWADPTMVEKMLFNILSNAFKVTPDRGKIKVVIKEKPTLMDSPMSNKEELLNACQISVKDTGPGIDQEDYKRIFKRFYQVSRLNKDHYGSSGLGLEMVNGFVKLHRGKIDVESELQNGTKFTLSFLMGKEHFSESEIFDQVKEQRSISREKKIAKTIKKTNHQLASEDKQTVLIVEDNKELLEYLEEELSPFYNIVSALNGKVGLSLAKEKMPHLIITDVVMPVMDGLTMCTQIKKDIAVSHIPLLMLTSKALVADRIKGIDAGADAYINKPFNIDVLKATLAGLLTSRQILIDKYTNGKGEKLDENITTIDNEFINKALNFIYEKIEEPDLSVEQLASDLFLSRSQLYRKIKTLTGLTVNEFIRKVRLEEAKKLILSDQNYNVNEIAFKVGFSSSSYFSRCFKKEYGHSPKKA